MDDRDTSATEANLSPLAISPEARELVAIEVHNYYLDTMAPLREGPGRVAPAARGWNGLGEEYREQNRAYVDSLPLAFAAVGLEICTIENAESGSLDEALVERLAELEHDRWCSLKIEQGYVAPGTADAPADRVHDHLLPFVDLDRSQRGFAIAQARNSPTALATAGLGVRRIAADPPA